MKVFGVSGSPRIGGTDFAVRHALHLLEEKGCETAYFSVKLKKIEFCLHCDYCTRKKEGCVHKDALAEFYDGLIWADGIVIGTPCYQGTLSGQTKTLLDRCRAILARDPRVLDGKVGMGIAVGGDRNGGQEVALRSLHDFYIIAGVIPVAGGAFGANLGATLWSRDQGGEGVNRDEDGLRSLRKTVKRFHERLERITG
ncbi:MAG: flavodoxin family protein [Deltaproteobacteria bacterium]|nr:flavodoxin family protein [Deltaproteobacteria bacterium]